MLALKWKNNSWPVLLWALLIPLVFLGHAYNENFGLAGPAVVAGLLVKYEGLAMLCLLFGWIAQRDTVKAYLSTALFLTIFFTFGTVQDWTRRLGFPIPYRILLPFIAGVLILFFYRLHKSSSKFLKSILYLKWLTVLCLLWETGQGIEHWVRSSKADAVQMQQENTFRDLRVAPTDSSQLPHVIWLIVDMYPSSASLQQAWQFSNPLDNWLRQQGFYVAPQALSSYNYTPFSISSQLNLQRLPNYSEGDTVQAKDQVSAIRGMEGNPVIRFFRSQNYQIDNFSLFDYAACPSRGWTFFGDLPKRLLDDRTLLARVQRDIGWKMERSIFRTSRENDSIQIHRTVDRTHARYQEYIKNWQASLQRIRGAQQPVLSVFHVMLPHEPYIYDSIGTLIYRSYNTAERDFIGQVMYTNSLLKNWIRQCLSLQDQRRLVLVVQGDHGYKYDENDERFTAESNRILLAVYDSKHEYGQWTEDVNGINIFRILLNQYFDQHLPLAKAVNVQLRYRN